MLTYFPPEYIAHLRHPKHVLLEESPEWTASGQGRMEGNRLRTHITMWVRGQDTAEGWLIEDLAWQVSGLPETVAAASALTDYVLSQKLNAAQTNEITVSQISQMLGGVPKKREDDILRAIQALRRALFAAEALETGPSEAADDELACHCMGLNFSDLRRLAHVETDRLNLQRRCGFGTGCGTCLYMVHGYLDDLLQ